MEGRGTLGGTCLNVGCIPSKALLNSSHKFHDAKHNMAGYGVEVADVRIDVAKMMKQKDDAVSGLTKGIEGLFKKNKVQYVKGWGRLAGPGKVAVALADGGEQIVEAKNVVLATGSEVTPLPGVPIDEERIVSSTGALKLAEVPEKMVVIGGGIIGLEMGSVWSRLGAKVEVIEFLDSIVPAMDKDVRKTFERILKKQGLKFKYKSKVTSAEATGGGVKLQVEPAAGGEAQEVEADVVLVAIGRRPVTEGLGLEEAGVEMEEFDVSLDDLGDEALDELTEGTRVKFKAEVQ